MTDATAIGQSPQPCDRRSDEEQSFLENPEVKISNLMRRQNTENRQPNQAVPIFHEVNETALSGQPWLQKFRFQLPAMAVFVLLLQLASLYIVTGAVVLQPTLWLSLIATQVGNIVGALSFRATQRVPGTRKLGFILPTMTACYGALILAAFVFPFVPTSPTDSSGQMYKPAIGNFRRGRRRSF